MNRREPARDAGLAQSSNAAQDARMRNALARFTYCLLLTAALPAAAADVTIYRCTDARGHLTLRDTPCAKGERQETREMLRPRDGAPAATAAPVQPRATDNAAPATRVMVLRAPQPLYDCVTPDGDHYTSDTPEGRPRWVPLWTLGYPVSMAPYQRAGADLAITGGNVSIRAGSTVLVPPPAYPIYPAMAGTWIRDTCHALPPQEVCARLLDRRDEIRRRFFNAQPSERDGLRVEERGINARLDNDCGSY
jgi:hypothetical protein